MNSDNWKMKLNHKKEGACVMQPKRELGEWLKYSSKWLKYPAPIYCISYKLAAWLENVGFKIC